MYYKPISVPKLSDPIIFVNKIILIIIIIKKNLNKIPVKYLDMNTNTLPKREVKETFCGNCGEEDTVIENVYTQ